MSEFRHYSALAALSIGVMFYPVCMRIEYCSIRTESMLQRDRGIRHEFWHGKASQWLWPYGHGNDQEAIKKVLKVSWDWILFQLDYSIKSSFSCTIDHRLCPSIVIGNKTITPPFFTHLTCKSCKHALSDEPSYSTSLLIVMMAFLQHYFWIPLKVDDCLCVDSMEERTPEDDNMFSQDSLLINIDNSWIIIVDRSCRLCKKWSTTWAMGEPFQCVFCGLLFKLVPCHRFHAFYQRSIKPNGNGGLD
ncbi:uncharacterized protein TRIADDRAFT_59448 [Trichoplax adhaerens]|uniref:Uncharacterized protein n=1 Tax=Trichoplax adhaerens TaxID=10228 RepID=B3S5R5_TRIAD|nr:predicted protein [Trichoplax adhaerens]EDV21945.1 predicted protein [Trichoplax adhaerens]|eukprot:XP_002115582.1 predicted protein [Trichoplax adhaerens]